MRPLPAPIDEIEIPQTFSPSQLANADGCLLHIILGSSSKHIPTLPSHPLAILGRVFHELLDWTSKVRNASISRNEIRDELARLLGEADASIANDPDTSHFPRLQETIDIVRWHNLEQRMLSACESVLNRSHVGVRRGGQSRRGPTIRRSLSKDWPCSGNYSELLVEAGDIRLRGRLDLLRCIAEDVLEITDYKTGRLLERSGEIRTGVVLQMRLYALMVRQYRPQSHVAVIASDGESAYHISTTDDELRLTLEWLKGIMAKLPAGSTVKAEDLATPGPSCRLCRYRHVCSAYLEAAPRFWNSGIAGGPLPNDAWGTVTNVEEAGDYVTLELEDVTNRRIKIRKLSRRHGEPDEYTTKGAVFLFGLGCTKRNAVRGLYYGSRNFYELPTDLTSERAWSLGVFGS